MKEKPRLYRYESYWTFPTAHWGDVDKDNATSNQKALAPGLTDGTLVGYGDDENLVRSREAFTHSNWWQANSTAGVLKVLDAFEKGGASNSSRLSNSTRHWTQKYYSQFYNWKAGSWKGAYGKRWTFTLRRGIDPDDAMRTLAWFYVPLFESLLADGTIVEYEIDREETFNYSADSAGHVVMSYMTPTADGSTTVSKAFTAAYANPVTFTVICWRKPARSPMTMRSSGIFRGIAEEHRSGRHAHRLRRLSPPIRRPLALVQVAGECPESPSQATQLVRTSDFRAGLPPRGRRARRDRPLTAEPRRIVNDPATARPDLTDLDRPHAGLSAAHYRPHCLAVQSIASRQVLDGDVSHEASAQAFACSLLSEGPPEL